MKNEEQINDDVLLLSVSLSKARKSIEEAIERLNSRRKEHVQLELSRNKQQDAQYSERYYNHRKEELRKVEHKILARTQELLGLYRKALQQNDSEAITDILQEADSLIKEIYTKLEKLPT